MSIDSASQLLTWSNRIYVFGAILTFTSAAMVLYEKRSKNQGREVRWGLATEIIVIIAAFICLCGTIGAITFGNIVSHLKDDDLAAYKKSADLQIEKAKESAREAEKDASVANQEAEEARLKAENTSTENTRLRIDVQKGQTESKKAEAALAAQEQKTERFTQGLAQQQQGMAQQMQTSPSLNDSQVDVIASILKPFAGQTIPIHVMMDARSGRLANRFGEAFHKANIKTDGSGTFVGPNYEGVMVIVKNPSPQQPTLPLQMRCSMPFVP